MKEIIVYIGDEQDIQNPKVVRNAFKLPKGKYRVTIKNITKRSLPQNSFLHVIMPDIQQALYDAGWRNIKTPERAKEFVKELFLTVKETNDLTGEVKTYVRHTSDLSKEEMAEFIDEIIQWAAEYLNLVIYSPNEQTAFSYAKV